VKSVRRAYTDGRLPFYRADGSQIILILDVDVDAWILRPQAPRRAAASAPAPVTSRGRRAPVARIDSRRRHDPGSREDLRAIERSSMT
jgi:hypothetical protein